MPRHVRAPREITVNTLYTQFPFYGVIQSWNSDRGFGFVQAENRSHKDFLHLSDNCGTRIHPEAKLEGAICLFAVGGSPKARDTSKSCAVRWIPLSDVGSAPEDYSRSRKEAIVTWDDGQFLNSLRARWYLDLWQRETPDCPLEDPDPVDGLIDRIGGMRTLGQLSSLLDAVTASPLFLGPSTHDVKKQVCIGVALRLAQLQTSCQLSELARILGQIPGEFKAQSQKMVQPGLLQLVASADDLSGLSEVIDVMTPEFRSELLLAALSSRSSLTGTVSLIGCLDLEDQRSVFLNRAVSIDIESDGTEIFQIGCAQGKQSELMNLSSADGSSLDAAIKQLGSLCGDR